eukprot:GHUV01042894.1.p1 GENE.GHUV01042894.1~~GHUV01042894.1.p1  ORF type:complete len:216 (-),score=27.99 GHUV01042894.1:345-956(-)
MSLLLVAAQDCKGSMRCDKSLNQGSPSVLDKKHSQQHFCCIHAVHILCAGDVIELKVPAGRTFSTAELTAALEQHKPAVMFLCQGESSTGTHQNLAGLGEVCERTGTLLLVHTVCSLGGVPLFADKWGVDCIYSGSQKCLSGPPGGQTARCAAVLIVASWSHGFQCMPRCHRRSSMSVEQMELSDWCQSASRAHSTCMGLQAW